MRHFKTEHFGLIRSDEEALQGSDCSLFGVGLSVLLPPFCAVGSVLSCHGEHQRASRYPGPCAVEVVVFNEIGDGPFHLTREFIRDMVHFLLNGLVVTFQFPVGLGMKECHQDMTDANKVQVVPEGSADVSRPVVREQSDTVLNGYLSHAHSINSFLDHLDEGIRRHVFLQLPSQDETRVVVHHGHQVVVTPAHHPEVGGVSCSHLVGSCGLGMIFLPCDRDPLLPPPAGTPPAQY